MITESIRNRFWCYVDKRSAEECWPWLGSLTVRGGYGQLMQWDGKKRILRKAHRLSYEMHNGPIAKGLFVCHRCNNARCVNPYHLYAGTPKDNWRDTRMSGRAFKFPKYQGENSPSAKLTERQVLLIRASKLSHTELGRRFGVTKSTIFNVRKNRSWKGAGK